ncbi:TetR/AcrR family transcriptional regulator [Nocardia jiangxiensis]|uniref:TetR/AcrR family transcriptional regulator n=1 Tax=Nocardia jiangxiensis TaxID=282685 RepID=A0ABW6SBX6_9NOCA
MPKRVDHDQRRREIAAALCRLAGERGLEGVSLSEVAAAAGMSKGLVQHYFRNKDLMLRYATGYLRERLEQRVADRTAAATSQPRELLRAVLLALLPLDRDDRTESLVATAFLFRALQDPAVAERFREGRTLLRTALITWIEATYPSGRVAPVQEADMLLALVSGLGDAVLLGYHTPEQATAILDRQLERLDAASAAQPG